MFSTASPELAPVIFIMGPTGSGKSSLAIELAEKLSGEIISADSMQIYKELSIGTAKPAKEELSRIPHHLINILSITEKFDVFSFRDQAEKAIAAIRERGKVPIVAGGTGLYMRALIYGLDSLPANPALRKELDDRYDNPRGALLLRQKMAEYSPLDLELFGQNTRKLIRALEVKLLTGKAMGELQKSWKEKPPRKDGKSFVLRWEKEALQKRQELRCTQMLQDGWINEAEKVFSLGLKKAPTAWQVLGYRQIAQYLAGEFSLDELEKRIRIATWQYARRQNTWFRTQHPEAIPIDMPCGNALEKILKNL